jgi:hypothetical protein
MKLSPYRRNVVRGTKNLLNTNIYIYIYIYKVLINKYEIICVSVYCSEVNVPDYKLTR